MLCRCGDCIILVLAWGSDKFSGVWGREADPTLHDDCSQTQHACLNLGSFPVLDLPPGLAGFLSLWDHSQNFYCPVETVKPRRQRDTRVLDSLLDRSPWV